MAEFLGFGCLFTLAVALILGLMALFAIFVLGLEPSWPF